MAGFSNYLELQVAKWCWGADSVTRPTAWYLALFTSDPADDNSGTEVSGGAYARKSISLTTTANPVTGPTVQQVFTASGAAWGTVTHWAIFDAVSAGNQLGHGALTASKNVTDGDSITFDIGSLTLTHD